MPMSHEGTLRAEVETWLIEDDDVRREKWTRERMRHYGLIHDLLLDKLPTSGMDVLEVGGGPMPVSDLLPFKSRIVVDPLSEDYAKVVPTPDHVSMLAEDMTYESDFDLAIATNSLDHVREPELVVRLMNRALRAGGYMAICCATNNSYTHPHPAHVHSLTAAQLHRWLDRDYETLWQKTYENDGARYGWMLYEGKRGQPAFYLLMRRCTGYVT